MEHQISDQHDEYYRQLVKQQGWIQNAFFNSLAISIGLGTAYASQSIHLFNILDLICVPLAFTYLGLQKVFLHYINYEMH